ncbi:substrate-binding periplasmic protein [Thalassotalea sediminis]|uniref:substrate-binding periplasmic protein n=1 Tax=Thalassotalea sediminis TaxID=1759089 RepID=UPI00257282A0|nr:transporter substrate-binding domain-containing protein [Thalassotalea sediminis]
MDRIFFTILLLAVFPLSAKQQVIFAAEDSWPPYSGRNGQGISQRLIESALADSQFSVEFISVPYARALMMTEKGLVNACFNVTRQKDTEQRFAFGEQALLVAKASYYYPVNKVKPYKSIEQLNDNTAIGLIIGYEYGDDYERNRHRFKEFRVSTQQQLIGMLINERIEVAIMFDEVATYTLAEMSLPQSAIVKGALNHQSDIYVAFSRKNADTPALIQALDRGLVRLNKESN